MSDAARLVRSARRYCQVSGRRLAQMTGSSQAGLVELERGAKDATAGRLERLLSALGYRLIALPTRAMTAADASEDIRERLERDSEDAAFRVILQLVTDLQAEEPAMRVALCVTPPASVSCRRFDALLAAAVDFCLAVDHLPRPAWLDEEWRTLSEPWDVEPVAALQARSRLRSPEVFTRHGIYLDPTELVNA